MVEKWSYNLDTVSYRPDQIQEEVGGCVGAQGAFGI